MNTRTRLSLTSAVLLVGAVTTACGGGSGGAPTDASEKDFCDTQSSLLGDLLARRHDQPRGPDQRRDGQGRQGLGEELEEVGTPEDIPDDARKGFEAVISRPTRSTPPTSPSRSSRSSEQGGADASEEARKQAQAFTNYLTEKCGNPLEDLDLPEMPEMPDSTE